MQFDIPQLSLVVLIGASGSGKSSFARKHFLSTEVLSSDVCRGWVSDDENNQAATKDAFELLHYIAAKRLAAGRLTVIDATNVQPESRRPLIALAREFHVLPVAIVLDLPEAVCRARNLGRADRNMGEHVIRNQRGQLHRSLRGLQREGFRQVHTLRTQEDVDGATIARTRLYNDRRDERGPFDIVGDVHGCFDELVLLLRELGYGVAREDARFVVTPPPGRKLVFVGDLVDRGPNSPDVVRLVRDAEASGAALCVAGNHDVKLARKLSGRDVKITHGLAESLAQLESVPAEEQAAMAGWLDGLISHYVLDDGRLVVAHAGLKQAMQGRASGAVRSFCMYGDTTGEVDDYGLPVRYQWAKDYRGPAMVVYGHTPVPEAEWLNNTICVDTGCVFGGQLTALRYPERELVSVPAARVYYEPIRPLQTAPETLTAQQREDTLLDLADVTGKRIVHTRLAHTVTIQEAQSGAALEVMSRFAIDPKWLIYLPPTMSPCATAESGELLEHPREAFAYYRSHGVERVVCEEKHMGSRAVVVLCRDSTVARTHFGVTDGAIGAVYTRTGRRFFNDPAIERAFLELLASTATRAGAFDELGSEWLLLDGELMPWSFKAQDLLRNQYASVGASARATLDDAAVALAAASARGVDVAALIARTGERRAAVGAYTQAYARYCWPVEALEGVRFAPFHLLASDGLVHHDKPHAWHLGWAQRLVDHGAPILHPTRTVMVDLGDADSEQAATAWWEQMTNAGGEGMVVKPEAFLVVQRGKPLQPGVKVRGREYLRIIYGPEYTRPEHLERLRARGLGAKRALALREFALGIEGLERFVRGEPLRRVHECAFAVLALETEPVDPRL